MGSSYLPTFCLKIIYQKLQLRRKQNNQTTRRLFLCHVRRGWPWRSGATSFQVPRNSVAREVVQVQRAPFPCKWSYKEVTSHLLEWLSPKWQRSVGSHMGKNEALDTVGRNTYWKTLYRKQYGDSSKKYKWSDHMTKGFHFCAYPKQMKLTSWRGL
jgi:hypothetical protein